MNKKRNAMLCLTAAASLVLAACGSGTTSTNESQGSSANSSAGVVSSQASGSSTPTAEGTSQGDQSSNGASSSAEPDLSKRDQTIRVAVDSPPESKGNPFNATGTPGVYYYNAIYDPLTIVDSDGTIKPALATEWKNTAPTTWDFTLRKDVSFSNGEALTAQGVASVITLMKTDPDLSTTAVANDLSNIASAKATGDLNLEITTTAPDPLLPNKMVEFMLPAPKVFTAPGGIQSITQNPIGTGPFEVVSWTSNKVTMKAFSGSWRAPLVGNLEIQSLQDPSARVQALLSGQVDLITSVSPDQVPQLTGDYTSEITSVAQTMSLAYINTRGDTPLANKDVRLALNYAVDRDAIAKNLLMGKAEPASQGASVGSVGYNKAITPYPYDVAEAKRLLAAGGYPNGFNMVASIVTGSYPADSEMYQLVKENLAQIGVNVELRQTTFPAWLKMYLSNDWGDVQMFGLSWNALPTMDSARPMSLFSCLKKPAFFCNESIAANLTTAMKDMDTSKRAQQLQAVSQEMHDDPPALYLIQTVDINGMSTKLQGFVDDNRFYPYESMFLK